MDPTTLNPVSIFLAKKGGGGDRVLFRYPYSAPTVKRAVTEIRKNSNNSKHMQGSISNSTRRRRNPYALSHRMLTEDPFNQNRFVIFRKCEAYISALVRFTPSPEVQIMLFSPLSNTLKYILQKMQIINASFRANEFDKLLFY